MEFRIVGLKELAKVEGIASFQIEEGHNQLDMAKAKARRHINDGHAAIIIEDPRVVGQGTRGYAPYLVAWKA